MFYQEKATLTSDKFLHGLPRPAYLFTKAVCRRTYGKDVFFFKQTHAKKAAKN